MNRTLAFILLLISFSLSYAQKSTKPKVLVITTGGTIASKTNTPLIEGNELIQNLPELTEYGDIDVEEFVKIGSSKMTPQIWLKLVNRIILFLMKGLI